MHGGKLSIPHYVGIMLIISPGFEEMYLNNWVQLIKVRHYVVAICYIEERLDKREFVVYRQSFSRNLSMFL